MLAPLGQTQLVMLLMRFAPAATTAFLPVAMTPFPNSCLLALIHYRPQHRKNAGPSIPIALAWCWAKARPCSRLRNSNQHAGVVRKFLVRSLATESQPII